MSQRGWRKKSSVAVIRLDFRSNCSVPASADTVGNVCPQLSLLRSGELFQPAGPDPGVVAQLHMSPVRQPMSSLYMPLRAARRFAGNGSGECREENTVARVDANTQPK